jgi:hypothetical protein
MYIFYRHSTPSAFLPLLHVKNFLWHFSFCSSISLSPLLFRIPFQSLLTIHLVAVSLPTSLKLRAGFSRNVKGTGYYLYVSVSFVVLILKMSRFLTRRVLF